MRFKVGSNKYEITHRANLKTTKFWYDEEGNITQVKFVTFAGEKWQAFDGGYEHGVLPVGVYHIEYCRR